MTNKKTKEHHQDLKSRLTQRGFGGRAIGGARPEGLARGKTATKVKTANTKRQHFHSHSAKMVEPYEGAIHTGAKIEDTKKLQKNMIDNIGEIEWLDELSEEEKSSEKLTRHTIEMVKIKDDAITEAKVAYTTPKSEPAKLTGKNDTTTKVNSNKSANPQLSKIVRSGSSMDFFDVKATPKPKYEFMNKRATGFFDLPANEKPKKKNTVKRTAEKSNYEKAAQKFKSFAKSFTNSLQPENNDKKSTLKNANDEKPRLKK